MSGRIDLVAMTDVAGNYHFANSVNEQLLIAANGIFQEVFNGTVEYSGSWTLDDVNDYFTLDWCAPATVGCGDEDIMALEALLLIPVMRTVMVIRLKMFTTLLAGGK